MVKMTTTLFLILLCMVLLLSLTACGGNKPAESGEGTGFTTTSTTSGETVSNSSATTGGTAGGESTTGTESTATKTAAVTTGTRPTAGQTGTSKTQKTTAVTTTATTQSLEGIEIGLISPKQGSKQWLGNDDIEEWLTAATPGRSGLYATGKDIYFLDECVLKWSCNGTPQGYTVDIATTSDLKDALTLSCVAPELVLEEPYTGVTYYWRVTAQFSGGTVVSDVFCFTVEEAPRTVRIEGVSNTRDIGCWSTESGGRIRQGMVYRAGSLDGITTVGKRQALSLLGLKTDLDLRRRGEGTAGLKSPIDPALNYVNVSGSYYTDENIGVHTAAGQAALREEFAVLADPANYPLIIHCSAGRDRTGTLVYLLQTLLGVSHEDARKEYEITFFSYSGCFQAITPGSSSMSWVKGIENIHDYLNSRYSAETLAGRTEAYLLDIGIPQEQLQTIKNLLLEE